MMMLGSIGGHMRSGNDVFLDGYGVVVTALSEVAELRSVADGQELTACFGRGGLLGPVRLCPTNAPDSTFLEFRPAPKLLSGSVDLETVQQEWARLPSEVIRLTMERRGNVQVHFQSRDRPTGGSPIGRRDSA